MYDDTVIDKAYYNKLKEQTTWISVKDRLPEMYQHILLYSKNMGYICGMFQNNYLIADDGCPMSMSYLIGINAYWMPLPEPPESEEE